MIKRFSAITFECTFFYLCLLIGLFTVAFNAANPTLDGPAHLYNAQLINYLIRGNEFIGRYYTLNKIPVSNLTDHYLLAFLLSIFSLQAVEKIFLITYLLSFCLLFRRLMWQWKAKNMIFSVVSIPFSFSIFYYWGFYNFCLSFPILFAIIIYYHKYFYDENKLPSVINYILFSFLSTLLYFTNGLAFLLAGLLIFLFELPVFVRSFQSKLNTRIKSGLKRIILLLLTWIPGTICFWVFLCRVPLRSGGNGLSFSLLRYNASIMWPLVVFGSNEVIYTRYIFYLVSIVLSAVVYYRARQKRLFKWSTSDTIIPVLVITFLLYLFVPDDDSVGMMSIRLLYFFFIFLVLWIGIQKSSKVFARIISIGVIIMHFILLFEFHQQVVSSLNKQVEIVEEAGKVIKPNSTLLAIDVTNNWMLSHFPDYLGVDKPLVIFDNYEASDGWFAVNWNTASLAKMQVDTRNLYQTYNNLPDMQSIIKYIFIYGDYNAILQKPEWQKVNMVLQKNYKLIYTSADNGIHVFSQPDK